MYFTENYKSKAAVKRALAAGENVRVRRTSEFETLDAGEKWVEGPWGGAHTFYGQVVIEDGGRVTSIS